MEAYEELRRLVEAVAEDVAKAERGNKAAGVRVRKQMQAVKRAAQEVRNAILELRAARGAGESPPSPPSGPTTIPPIL